VRLRERIPLGFFHNTALVSFPPTVQSIDIEECAEMSKVEMLTRRCRRKKSRATFEVLWRWGPCRFSRITCRLPWCSGQTDLAALGACRKRGPPRSGRSFPSFSRSSQPGTRFEMPTTGNRRATWLYRLKRKRANVYELGPTPSSSKDGKIVAQSIAAKIGLNTFGGTGRLFSLSVTLMSIDGSPPEIPRPRRTASASGATLMATHHSTESESD